MDIKSRNMCIILMAYTIVNKNTFTVNGSGVVTLRLVSYTSIDNKDASGTCCEHIISQTNCGTCDPYIQISLDEANHPWTNIFTTSVHRDTNNITFGNTLSGSLSNPFKMNFPTFLNSLVVTFEVWDDDSADAATSPPDKLEVVTFQVGQGEPVPFNGVSSFTRKTLNGKTLTLTFEYIIQCSQYYYGNCDTYCRDKLPQYTCNSQGHKICQPDWTGLECDVQVKLNYCDHHGCKNGATCINSSTEYTCICEGGFTGIFCETSITTAKVTTHSASLKSSTELSSTATTNKAVSVTATQSTPLYTKATTTEGITLTTLSSSSHQFTQGATSRNTSKNKNPGNKDQHFPMTIGIIIGSSVIFLGLLGITIFLVKRHMSRRRVRDHNAQENIQKLEK